MRIGILGTGAIAEAVVRGIAADGHEITVSDRSATRAAALAREVAGLRVAPNQAVLEAADVVILGLVAGAAATVLPGLRFRPGQRVISLMAGAALTEVAAWVAPARAEAVMLPYPAIAAGGSPILAFGDTGLVTALFGARNRIFALASEAELADFLVAQAVLSPLALALADTAAWLAPRVSDPAAAEVFLRDLVATSLAAGPLRDLLTALDTPGGYNRRLRQHMERAGLTGDLRAGLDDLAGRAPPR
ncbi:NAD(P)-binding domain-containing protein [Rhodobacter capsulatus]|uniref:Pyrroline-5-carboxylate reductase n=1 Tax=Rhodobacter capsulatus (strain ATCC BAA-309 / NBRC 16581 / SB1003) TaxID=272942 RepID=D5ARJ5_RHOCB|nr:NAD(P)-binding domain-containing protein [Rhodobacter capsulatus]ADE84866.1 pyrroline-5-carboxylate reductase [Rhodobacter capsulatus SB 1003]ETD02307.1 pyrroline-5-carboxylate reductase [Rhodobacter capsulatus DE442]ETD77598.1 pyrroline-5-carboxylate reductase [Rhodobacter capsulatus R121]ETE54248.1 pyrroline-5-carboxylate reductase [Rhodobacter capsulatus Y262]MDS0925733.1 NAD(P)-binding domain-containing protein [Rhodobacter capsulatus]